MSEADRVEHEHVALELAMRDAGAAHRGDQVVVRNAFEQRQSADQRVGALEAGWYHRADRGALLDGQVRHLAGELRCDHEARRRESKRRAHLATGVFTN